MVTSMSPAGRPGDARDWLPWSSPEIDIMLDALKSGVSILKSRGKQRFIHSLYQKCEPLKCSSCGDTPLINYQRAEEKFGNQCRYGMRARVILEQET